MGLREPLQPGALASRAGFTLEERVAMLERGSAGRPGPGVSNGSALASDSSQIGGMKWALPQPILVANLSGRLDDTGAGTFYLPASGGMGWDGGGSTLPRDAHLFQMKRTELALYKGGATCSVRIRGTVLSNATAWGGTLTLVLYEVTSSAGGGNDVQTINRTARATTGTVTLTANMLTKDAVTQTVTLNSTNFPTDNGTYLLACTFSGAGAANSQVTCIATVEIV